MNLRSAKFGARVWHTFVRRVKAQHFVISRSWEVFFEKYRVVICKIRLHSKTTLDCKGICQSMLLSAKSNFRLGMWFSHECFRHVQVSVVYFVNLIQISRGTFITCSLAQYTLNHMLHRLGSSMRPWLTLSLHSADSFHPRVKSWLSINDGQVNPLNNNGYRIPLLQRASYQCLGKFGLSFFNESAVLIWRPRCCLSEVFNLKFEDAFFERKRQKSHPHPMERCMMCEICFMDTKKS